MAISKIVKKNNPETESINPENFKLAEEDKENLSKPESLDLSQEKKREQAQEKKDLDKIETNLKDLNTSGARSSQALSFHQRREEEIDTILSAGLHEIFLKMSPKKQQEFKLAGEDTAKKINALLDKTKINISKIISLIKKWLKIIPGVNQFFLEKEAKIKADKIINIKDRV